MQLSPKDRANLFFLGRVLVADKLIIQVSQETTIEFLKIHKHIPQSYKNKKL